MRRFTYLKGLHVLELNLTPIHDPFVSLLLDPCQDWCSELTTLVLFIKFMSLNPVDLVSLDSRFKTPSFRALKEVCFRYDGPCDESGARLWLNHGFPHLAQAAKDDRLQMRVEMRKSNVYTGTTAWDF